MYLSVYKHQEGITSVFFFSRFRPVEAVISVPSAMFEDVESCRKKSLFTPQWNLPAHHVFRTSDYRTSRCTKYHPTSGVGDVLGGEFCLGLSLSGPHLGRAELTVGCGERPGQLHSARRSPEGRAEGTPPPASGKHSHTMKWCNDG